MGRYQRGRSGAPLSVFEPRLNAATLRVTPLLDKTRQGSYNTLQFEIRGQILTQPYPTGFLVRSALDMELSRVRSFNTGHYSLDHELLEYYNRELSYLRGPVLSSPPSIPLPPDWGCGELHCRPVCGTHDREAFSFSERPYSAKRMTRERFAQRLLEVVSLITSPHAIDGSGKAVSRYAGRRHGEGVTVPRDTAFVSPIPEGENTACGFAAAGRHAVALSIEGTPDRRAAGYARPAPLSAIQYSCRRGIAHHPANLRGN